MQCRGTLACQKWARRIGLSDILATLVCRLPAVSMSEIPTSWVKKHRQKVLYWVFTAHQICSACASGNWGSQHDAPINESRFTWHRGLFFLVFCTFFLYFSFLLLYFFLLPLSLSCKKCSKVTYDNSTRPAAKTPSGQFAAQYVSMTTGVSDHRRERRRSEKGNCVKMQYMMCSSDVVLWCWWQEA